MKSLRKIFYIILIIAVSGIAISGLAVVIYKDKIIDLLKTEIDQHIKTRLEVKSIELKLIKGFPNISIEFTGVKFHSAFDKELLVESEHIYFVLNIIDLFNNEITIERLEIENAKFVVHKNSKGDNNFDVFINSDTIGNEDSRLNIKATKFSNVEIVNIDEVKSIYDVYNISNLQGSVLLNDSIYHFDVEANAILNNTNEEYLYWLVGKQIYVKTQTSYSSKLISFEPSEFIISKSQFNFNGYIGLDSKKKISINLKGKNLDFSKVITLLPDKYQKNLLPFNGKGTIGFNAALEGNFTKQNWPSFDASFNVKDFKVDHSELEYPMEEIYLDGKVHVKDVRKLETGQLDIKKISASINNSKIEIGGSLNNFYSPIIKGEIKGKIDVAWALSLLLKDAQSLHGPSTGMLDVDLTASLKINNKEKEVKIDDVVFNGKINFNEVSINNMFNLPLKEVTGEASFSDDKIELLDLSGIYGGSDFEINGFVLVTQAMTKDIDNKFEAKIDLTSNNIELDEITETIINLPTDSTVTSNQKPSFFFIDLDLKVNHLIFRRFHGENFRAEVFIDQNGLKINRASSNGLGGAFALTGSITNQLNNDYYIEAKARTKSLHLDSLFYVFNNFKQDFITDSVIKGEMNSDVYTYMYFDKNWSLKRNLLYAEGLLQVKKGELNDFKPMMSLSSHLKNEEENLAKLRFSDLESSIIISNDTVYISDMNIGSNVRNIKIGGYHTLDQHIDYRLSVPVSSNKKDKDEAFGEVKKDKDGKLYMPFRIKGTTTDYKVSYDLKRASSNFVKGVRKELSEIGNSLKGNQTIEDKGDTLLLEEDELFDWDND